MLDLGAVDLSLGSGTRTFYFRPGTSDEAVVRSVFSDHQYGLGSLGERGAELMQRAERYQSNGIRPLIVDAGANIGAASVHFRMTFASAMIVAIEPESKNYALLSRNVEGLDIEAVCAGVSARPGRLRVTDPGRGDWAFQTERIDQSDEAAGVPATTINEIYARYSRGFLPFIVKIDIEGAEHDLFSENTEWLARTPLVIIELHDWMLPRSGTSKPFLRCIADLDRDFVSLGENIFSIANDIELA